MPLSRIIKAEAGSHSISAFSFRPMHSGESLALEQPGQTGCSFVPLELFDPSELKDNNLSLQRQRQQVEAAPEIPGRFVSDEEMQHEQQESYQRGLQDGKNLAERGLLNVFRSLRTAAEEIEMLREKILRDSEDALLALVIAVSRKIILQEVSQDKKVVVNVIKAALANLKESDDLIIRVHPDDHVMLSTSKDQGLQKELGAVRFTLKSDSSLQQGCCQIETLLGTVDASFDAQLEEIFRKLMEERSNSAISHETRAI